MKRLGPSWIAVVCVAAVACQGFSTEPASVLPRDAPAFVVFAPPARIRESFAPVMARLPEAAGVVDLVRSITGVCLDDDAGTRDNGLDPERGPALALWSDAVLAVLPLRDEAVALRRLRLRLARFGFIRDDAGRSGQESFHHLEIGDWMAVIRPEPGLALVCIGAGQTCGDVRSGTGWDPGPVREEMSAGDAVAVGVVRHPLLAGVARDLGLVREPGAGVALALLQDVRFAVGLDQGVWVRVAAGPTGPPVAPRGHEAVDSGLAAVASIALPPGVETAVTRRLDARGAWGRWTGEAGAAILASEARSWPLPAGFRDVLARTRWVAAWRFRGPDGAENALRDLRERVGPGGPAHTDSPVAAPGGTITWGGVATMATVVNGNVLLVGSEAGRPTVLGVGLGAILPGRDEVTVLRLRVVPGALLDAIGGGSLEYLGRMVRAVETIGATLTFEAGRWVMTVEAGLR